MIKDFENQKIGWKKSVRPICRKQKVLIANLDNGGSLFISKECYEILQEAIEQGMTFKELLDCIEDMDSRKYMEALVTALRNIRVWNYEGEKIKSEFFDISVDITNNCNLRCRHCCVSAGELLEGKDVDETHIMELFRKVLSLNPACLTISGGEALCRPDFKKIVSYIRGDYHKILTLMTNATLIDEDMAAFICKNFDSVDVSIDGCDEESCSKIRGEGTFKRCIQGIELLQKCGMKKISASMVLARENEYARDGFIKLCKDMGLHPIIRSLDISGRAASHLHPPIVQHQKRSCEDIKNSFVKNEMWKFRPQVMACQGAKVQFLIGFQGNIYPCGAMLSEEFCMGNVYEIENLKEYLENQEFHKTKGYQNFESCKPYHDEKCGGCDFSILCFSCANEVKNARADNSMYKDCVENSFYYDLYWENYESN